MKKIVRKWYSNYEKEEKWLNEMSAKGLALTEYKWCKYIFEDCRPNEYIYRIELLENLPSHPESQSYLEFMKETGVEFVSSYMRWVYVRKKAAEGAFDVYSDMDSRIRHYQRIVQLWGIIGLVNLMIFINNFYWGFKQATDLSPSFWLWILNLIVGSLLIGACVPYVSKIKRLQKEKLLRE